MRKWVELAVWVGAVGAVVAISACGAGNPPPENGPEMGAPADAAPAAPDAPPSGPDVTNTNNQQPNNTPAPAPTP